MAGGEKTISEAEVMESRNNEAGLSIGAGGYGTVAEAVFNGVDRLAVGAGGGFPRADIQSVEQTDLQILHLSVSLGSDL